VPSSGVITAAISGCRRIQRWAGVCGQFTIVPCARGLTWRTPPESITLVIGDKTDCTVVMGRRMSLLKILDINVHFIRKANSNNFVSELSHEIEAKLASLDDVSLPYDKPEIIQLIVTIETYKMQCLRGEITAKQLYHDVDHALSLFKIKHPGFDYLKDPALNAYF